MSVRHKKISHTSARVLLAPKVLVLKLLFCFCQAQGQGQGQGQIQSQSQSQKSKLDPEVGSVMG